MQAHDRLPRARITDVLLDVDAWTGFSDCFTHRRTGRTCDDRAALLTCVLADGINLGLVGDLPRRVAAPARARPRLARLGERLR